MYSNLVFLNVAQLNGDGARARLLVVNVAYPMRREIDVSMLLGGKFELPKKRLSVFSSSVKTPLTPRTSPRHLVQIAATRQTAARADGQWSSLRSERTSRPMVFSNEGCKRHVLVVLRAIGFQSKLWWASLSSQATSERR